MGSNFQINIAEILFVLTIILIYLNRNKIWSEEEMEDNSQEF